AHLINAGRPLELPPTGEPADFYFVQEDDPERLTALAVEIATRRIPARFRLNPLTDVQVLSPMRRFQLGADALNLALQQAVNPDGPALQHNNWLYR
ncbi:MAG: ATP-dependent RecD-like DNA helicase, partial [Kiritimatiellia bacterium]